MAASSDDEDSDEVEQQELVDLEELIAGPESFAVLILCSGTWAPFAAARRRHSCSNSGVRGAVLERPKLPRLWSANVRAVA